MFLSKRSDQINHAQMQPGQTLFQYLKRKKHLGVKQSLQSSLQKVQPSKQQVPSAKQQVPISKIKQFKKDQQQQPLRSVRGKTTKRRSLKSSDKRKIESSFDSKNSRKENDSKAQNLIKDLFNDEKSTKRFHMYKEDSTLVTPKSTEQPPRNKTPQRSFISMISPLKNRQNIASISISKIVDRGQEEKKSTIGKITQFSTKKMIKQAMTKVQKYYNRQVEFEEEIKERLKQFFLKLNKFIVELGQQIGQNFNFQKKMKDIKSSIKLLNGFLASNSTKQEQNISQMIDSLYREINQIIDTFEGQVQKQSRSSCEETIQKLKQQYEEKIQSLNKEKAKLNRELNLAIKETSKIQKDYNKLLQKCNSLQELRQNDQQLNHQRQQQLIGDLEQQITNLTEQNNQLLNELKETQTKLKESEYKHQQFVRKTNLEHDEQLNSREAYLLKELSTMKQECANDINNINKYYLTKIQQYPPKIKILQDIIQEQTGKIQLLNEKLKNTQVSVESQRAKVIQAKKKVDSALLDMCKVNEELFKHWLALKDVRTLLTRLGMFEKFQRIYRDIPYDETLFIL